MFALPASLALAPEAAVAAPAEAERRSNAIQLDLGLAVIGVAYERIVERHVAFHLTGHIFGTWFGPLVDQPNFNGFGGGARASFFLTGDAPRGLYVAPFLRIERVTPKGGSESDWGYSTGSFAGWSFVFADRFNLRVGAGLQLLAYQVVDVDRQRVAFRALFPALDLVVGWAF